MDIASLVGLVLGVVFVVVSVLLDGNLLDFADLASVMITIGGTFSATLISYPLPKFINSLKTIRYIFKEANYDAGGVIHQIIDLANIARKEGLLALEEAVQSLDDEFLKKGILLIVDGTDPELVRNILETELAFIDGRHRESQSFWETIASLGPAWGMIGTLIGLVNMLQKLDNPDMIGPSMAVALLTTLYGSLLANLLANPIANKLKIRSDEEILLKEVMIEGLLSIQAGENPRIIEEKLKAFLSPALRKQIRKSKGEEEVGER